MVHKGNAEVRAQAGSPVELKGGHQLTINGAATAQAKIGKDSNDFEQWGQERAETLAALNNRIDIRDTMVGQRSNQSSGMWFYSGFWGSYVYMPYSDFYTSPYGYFYNAFYDPYYWGNRYYRNGGGVVTNPTGGGNGGGTTTGPTRTVVASGPRNSPNAGPIQHHPTGDRPGPAGRSGGNAVSRVSPGPTHGYSGGGASRGDGGSYGNSGGSYNGGGGGGTSGGSVSAPSSVSSPAPSAPSSRGGSPSSGGGGAIGKSRGN
jgi:hypothetical protein